MPANDPRAAGGLPLSAVNLPLLGSKRAPRTTFQYLLHAVSADGATFGCPSWLVRREHFQAGDQVDFHFPFRTRDGWHRHHGEIVQAALDEENAGQVCRAVFRDRAPLHHPVFASVETGDIAFSTAEGGHVDRDGLLDGVLKDCMLQKRGVSVYFKHLVPLFSRITLFPQEDFGALRSMLLEDVRKRIGANVAAFENWHRLAGEGKLSAPALSRDLDLESLRVATESELETDVLEATFATAAIRPYIDAIRLLEDKLYLNYNTLVLLFAEVL